MGSPLLIRTARRLTAHCAASLVLAVAAGLSGCAPRLHANDALTIERALTPKTASTYAATAIDGDTLDDPTLGRIRLEGIDTPEVGEPGADEATRFLDALVRGRRADIAFSPLWPRDVYGRRRAVVYTPGPAGPVCANVELYRRGYARASRMGPTSFPVAEWAKEPPRTLPAAAALSDAGASPEKTVVYATRTGAKYHRAECPHARNAQPLSLASALARGLEPCSACRPPVVTE